MIDYALGRFILVKCLQPTLQQKETTSRATDTQNFMT